MVLHNVISVALIVAGFFFFLVGLIGVLRFPDVFTRLHALTKADNVGLGLVVVGLSFQARGPWEVVELLLIWFLVMAASTTAAHLIARTARHQGMSPWKEAP
jgi:multicomponent Na+:H+ antiporter subunit G